MRRLIFLLIILTFRVFATWPAGGVKVVQTPEAIENPQMVYLEDGPVIISWEADRLIYCQKLDTTGIIHWDAEGVRVCLSDSSQIDYHMVTDGQDVWFVWQDERNDDGDIYAQKFSGSTGQRLWGEQGREISIQTGEQALPLADVLPNNQLGVIWQDYGPEEPELNYDARAQWLELDGQPRWGENGISLPRDMSRRGRQGCFRSGEHMLALFSGRRESDTTAMFAQRIDSDGNFLWDTLGVLIEHAKGGFYGVRTDGFGGAVVLFSKGDGKVYSQRIDSLGQIRWTEGGVIVGERYSALKINLFPQEPITGLISDNMGGCFVWFGQDGTMRGQHVDSTGGIMWGINGSIYWTKKTYYEGPLVATKLCSNGNNGILAVYDNLEWGDSLNPTIDLGVLVQRIDVDGQPVFDGNGVMIRQWPRDINALPWDRFISAAAAVPGGVISTWGDNRDQPDYSLYAQIVDTTGKVGSGIEEESLPLISTPILEVSSTIASGNVLIRYSLPVKESGTIKLYDAAGKLIKSQNINQSQGVITWDTQKCPLGVYFVQLSTSNNERVNQKVLIVR